MTESNRPNDYKKTLNLPKTDFPMRANLAQKEVELLDFWERLRPYPKALAAREGGRRYILHDGPPYANGHIHIGHALNKILKDFIVKSKTLSGFAAPYVPGWDCHGLPIEHQVMKSLGPKKEGMPRGEIRRLCREYAQKFVDIQRGEFKRLGVFGDWDHPYLTMDPGYEAAIVREFGKAVAAGAVYKGKKPVLWCPVDETALAEAEVEYNDHASPSIYVKFPVTFAAGPPAQRLMQPDRPPAFVLIWTTTPWTLPANLAIALNEREEYSAVEVQWKGKKETWILATKRLEDSLGLFGLNKKDYVVTERWRGMDLSSLRCRHPWIERKIDIVFGDHVTMEQGTGCVHTAPGHGVEDYQMGLEYGLDIYAPVDHQGSFTDDVPQWAGMNVFKANPKIIAFLQDHDRLVASEQITHSYPHCWRCKNPVIFRATDQWFISMGDEGVDPTESLRGRALGAIAAIANQNGWIPPWGRDRIYGMIENRPDWCISRQRVWGVPIVAFSCRDCRAPLFSQKIADHVADLMEKEGGGDLWFSRSAEELLPGETVCPACRGVRFEKENDILDVWFESGVSHAAVLRRRADLKWPADLYLEGSDQHRGWFHSALLTALLSYQSPPYEAVLTHGFVVDGSGKKMSKSAGNVVAPQEVIGRYGAEILRLWVAATDFREDVRISPEILGQLVEAYRKIRNTARFLLGNLYDFDPRWAVDDAELWELDLWALHRLQLVIRRVRQAYDRYEFHTIFHALNNFSSVDLSSFYLDILKDRLYTFSADSPDRRAAQKVLYEILDALTRLMAPILSFTAEELWQRLPGVREASVHMACYPEAKEAWIRPDLDKKWDLLISIRQEVARLLEGERRAGRIGSSLEARVSLGVQPELYRALHDGFGEETLAAIFIVSQVALERRDPPSEGEAIRPTSFPSGLQEIRADRAWGSKCERCWSYRLEVGEDLAHPSLCRRCAGVVRGAQP